MNKAFTKEHDDEEPEQPEIPTGNTPNYVTPTGRDQLQNELQQLLREERPKLVETVSWAAKNGDRSENGDYIYGKKRLREIDRRTRYLIKRLDTAKVVDPKLQKNLTNVFFGATVTYIDSNKIKTTVQIVGIDEANMSEGKISWLSPVAKTLLKAKVGDTVTLKTPKEKRSLNILSIKY